MVRSTGMSGTGTSSRPSGRFPGAAGFGVVEVADEAELNQLIIEMPFSWFSDMEVRPFVDGAEGFQQLKQAVDAMAAVA